MSYRKPVFHCHPPGHTDNAAEHDDLIHAAVHLHMLLAGCLLSRPQGGFVPMLQREDAKPSGRPGGAGSAGLLPGRVRALRPPEPVDAVVASASLHDGRI